jgi:3-oxoacyl-ACP reductase-like protein
MSLFGNILAKLGFGADKAAAPAPVPAQTAAASATDAPADAASAALAAAAPVSTMTEVDVVAKLDGLAALNPEKLNWKVSIVDLMKLLGLDSSLAQRKELATELGCPADKMADSAQMNMWLHKTVLQKLAENGGNVPKELLG